MNNSPTNSEVFKFNFEDLKVWQNSIELSKIVYKETKSFPKEERYGLTGQVRRAAISVALNISEGKGRFHKKEFIQFLYLARGSLYEVVTCIKLAENMGYISCLETKNILQKSFEIQRQLNGLINSLK
ncbi:MAG: four helix bundle protein [Candidatus Moranbacteria bacterium]|nr:four helix bundle protein [Candidatus Moranbacteria bacterium]